MLSNVSILPTTPVTTASLSSIRTDNILLTSNKGKGNGKKCKRPGAYSTANMRPTSVARRNARERNRVRQVNNGFTALRDHLPYMPEDEEEVQNAKTAKDKKVSKVETLKRAVEYIKSLQRLLDERDGLCSPGAMSTSASSVPGGCLSPPGSYYNSPADGCHSPSSAAPNASWTGHQQTTVGTPQAQSHQQHRRHHQHQLYDLQSIGSSGEHHQTHVPGQQHQYVAHHQQHHQQVAVFGHHQHPMSNHSSLSSLSPGAFSKPGSPTPSVSSDASSPVRLSKVKVEPQLDQLDNFQDSQQLNTSYAGSYDELTPLSPDDEELLDAIAWWQQN